VLRLYNSPNRIPREWRLNLLICFTLGLSAVAAQETAPVPPAATSTSPATAADASTPPPPPIFENTGKPITIPFQCTDGDIQHAGLTCSEEDPCPVYLELTTVDGVGNRILAAGNLHAPAVTLYSILLASQDGGRTWREAHDRVKSAGLDHIQFLDAETGWVTGQVLSPLPQDPFLLVTLDGGKTWRQRPILSESADNRVGTIQQFSFSGKDNGSLIVDHGPATDGDRYELIESRDAGENWSIKESSTKPLRLRRPPPEPTADWRVRADGRTQSFQIEKRVSSTAAREQWSSIAAFAVKLAPCKPQPQAPKEAPPEQPSLGKPVTEIRLPATKKK